MISQSKKCPVREEGKSTKNRGRRANEWNLEQAVRETKKKSTDLQLWMKKPQTTPTC